MYAVILENMELFDFVQEKNRLNCKIITILIEYS